MSPITEKQYDGPKLERVFGLQTKITLAVTVFTVCVAVLVSGVFLRMSGKSVTSLQVSNARSMCKLLAELGSDPMKQGNRSRLKTLSREFASGDPVVFVAFCDEQGHTIESSDRHGFPVVRMLDTLPITGEEGYANPVFHKGRGTLPDHLDLQYPVLAHADSGSARVLGYARIGFNIQPTINVFKNAVDMATGIGVGFVFLAVPVTVLLVRRFVRPLEELTDVASKLAKGERNARSRIRRTDEIGELALSFNHMADEVERHQHEIEQINAELELRVRDRTRQLREMAARDPLTGLYNRRHLKEVLDRRFSEATRYSIPLSCLMIDLDNFKQINDVQGHQAGDSILVLAAETISKQLRAADVAARYGGDEFIVLLPHTDSEQAEALSLRIRTSFRQKLQASAPDANVSLSVGISSLSNIDYATAHELVQDADRALYESKNAGKDCVTMAQAH